jgi:hypothetical protein
MAMTLTSGSSSRTRFRAGGAAAVALLAVLAAAGPVLANAEVGTPAPDFTLQGVDGDSYTLSDYAGNVIFLAHIGYG